MVKQVTPGVQRRRLSIELRRARDEARLTQREVAEEMGWSVSKLIRVETGRVRVSRTDLKALLSHYGLVDSELVDQLVRLAQEGRTPSRASYRDVLDPEFVIYLDYESAASSVRQFENLFMPGLLQTEEYALRIMRSFARPGTEERVIERQLSARMERQGLLDDAGTRFEFVLDEAAVRRWVGKEPGDCSIMRQQLRRLVELTQRPNISVQIVPFEYGFYPGMRGSFVLLGFPDPADGDLLFLENERGSMVTKDDRRLLDQYRQHFDGLGEVASPAVDLEKFVSEVIDGMPGGPKRRTRLP